MGLLLDISPKALEKVIYFASYIVLDPKDTGFKVCDIISEREYREAEENMVMVLLELEWVQKQLENCFLNWS